MILVKLSNNKWHNLSNTNQRYMAQNRTNGGLVSSMYEILNAYKYFRILLHFGNHSVRHVSLSTASF